MNVTRLHPRSGAGTCALHVLRPAEVSPASVGDRLEKAPTGLAQPFHMLRNRGPRAEPGDVPG